MDQFFYHKALRKTILSFLDVFNGIQVAKLNKDGSVKKYVDVPINFAPKEKFYTFLNNHTHAKRYPRMVAEITSIEYDSQRKSGAQEKVPVKEDSNLQYYISPAPYNVSFELKVATEYITEMEQITSQILPFFDNHIYNTIYIDEIDDEWNLAIYLDSVSIDQDAEIEETQGRTVIWSFDFTVQTYISRPIGDVELIKTVISKIYTTEDAWTFRNNTDTESTSGIGHDSVEYYTEGYKDDDGDILYKYEIFEGDN